jgi:predicted dinucleotide-binding enzyme
MQAAISNVKQRTLVLGAGELGLAVLQRLADRSTESTNITVLLPQADSSAERALPPLARRWQIYRRQLTSMPVRSAR